MPPSDTCPTVLIKNEKGEAVRINESDFDAKKHELFKPAAAEKPAPVLQKATEGQLLVTKNGKSGRGSKFIIVNDKGEKASELEFDTDVEAFAELAKLSAAQTPEA